MRVNGLAASLKQLPSIVIRSLNLNEEHAIKGPIVLLVLVLNAIIPFLFLLGFSGMGYGLKVVNYSQTMVAPVQIQSIVACVFLLHVFDLQYWPGILLKIICTVVFAAICISLCTLVAVAPYGPICIFTVLVPLSMFGIKNTLFQSLPGHVLVGWNHRVFLSMASIILVSFFYWCSINGNMWESETNAEYSHKAGCAVDFTILENCENENVEGVPCFFDEYYEVIQFSDDCPASCIGVYQACEEAFIIWSFPGLAAMTLFVMGFISKFLENPTDPYSTHHLTAVAKFCAVFLFLFWIFASLAGAGEGLSNSLIAFAISMYIGFAIVCALVFWKSLVYHASKENLDGVTQVVAPGSNIIIKEVQNQIIRYMDVFRGLVVLAFSPLILVYVLISIVNQAVRRLITRHCFRTRVPDADYEHNGCFTLAVQSQIDDFFTWDYSKILAYSVYWGVGYVFLNVLVSKFTTVFLSWLISYTADMNLFAVTLIIIAVGMFLFMLPPIPGLPIYLTAGIVLVSVGSNTLGLYGAIIYACIVSLLLKLLACAVQQKMIGGSLGGNVGVKQMVSINSEGIRAMRVILSEKGFAKRKVAVLVGGPDWPVSVLCGILGLDLFPILIGTIPVVLLIVPTVLTGSFAYMGSIEGDNGVDLYPWAGSMGAMASAFAAGVMLFFTLAAAGAVKKTLENEKDAIEAIPLDEAVKEADEEASKKDASYRRVTEWSGIPFVMKFILILSVLTMMGCCYLLVIFNSQCFRDYDLMFTIKQDLDGNWTNIVEPLGRVALLLFGSSCALYYGFVSWAKSKVETFIESMDEESRATPLTNAD